MTQEHNQASLKQWEATEGYHRVQGTWHRSTPGGRWHHFLCGKTVNQGTGFDGQYFAIEIPPNGKKCEGGCFK